MNNSIKTFLENNMKNKRIEFGLSQRECAKKLGVSLVSYQNWERGMCSPKAEKIELICELFGFKKDDMV